MKAIRYLMIAAVVLLCGSSTANPLLRSAGLPGFIVLAEQRFDPAVQRYMAEQSLGAMPLKDGQLYFVYPIDTSRAYIEQMQIRYLEVLMEKQSTAISDEPNPGSP